MNKSFYFSHSPTTSSATSSQIHFPHSLLLSWNPPQKANGVRSVLFIYGWDTVYSGNGENTTQSQVKTCRY